MKRPGAFPVTHAHISYPYHKSTEQRPSSNNYKRAGLGKAQDKSLSTQASAYSSSQQ
jgi:hypothetical protein